MSRPVLRSRSGPSSSLLIGVSGPHNRHPGLDPGSMRRMPDQVRHDERRVLHQRVTSKGSLYPSSPARIAFLSILPVGPSGISSTNNMSSDRKSTRLNSSH